MQTAAKKIRSDMSGQVLAEILIAGGIFALVTGAILGLLLDSYRATTGGEEDSQATFFAQEGLDAARAIRDDAWTNLTIGNHGLTRVSGAWQFSGASETVSNKYMRTIIVEDANRSARDGDIVTSGGTNYGRTKKVTSQITWTTDDIARTVDAVAYLTDWNVFDWFQTSRSEFLSGTLTNASTSGIGASADIILTNSQSWQIGGGTTFFQTSSSDFSGGTFVSTSLIGSGVPADIELATSTIWASVTSPTGQDINEVYLVSANDGWAVGGSGKILRWDGLSWTEFVDTGVTDHFGLHMVSTNDGWATGGSGKIFRWNGASWSLFVDTGTETWNAVFMVSSSDGWVVGNGGNIRRWNGTAWNTVTSPVVQDLNSVYMVSASDGWAVGASGKIIRWNGTSWSEFVDTGTETWNDVFMVSTSDGWAVGNAGDIRRWNGTSWDAVASAASHLASVHMVSASDGWAVGNSGIIMRWNGSSWSQFVDTGNQGWISVFMVSADEGWTVGAAGVIYHYTTQYVSSGTFSSAVFDSGAAGTTWNNLAWSETLAVNTNLTIAVRTGPTATPDVSWSSFSVEYSNPSGQTISPTNNRYFQYRVTLTTTDSTVTSEFHDITVIYNAPTSEHIQDVSMLSTSDGWAVANAGVILRWNGSSWSSFSSPVADNLNGMDMVSSTDGWSVGNGGKILRWNGTSWSEHTDTGNEIWNEVDLVSSTDGWAVGNAGNVTQWNGTSWGAVTSVSAQNLNSVSMVSSSDGWAVGGSGNILRWNGASWSLFVDTGTETWNAVFMVSSSDGWVVGNGGNIRRWNGTAWNNVTSPTSSELFGVDMVSSTDGWAVGTAGAIIRWDGTSWSTFTSPTSSNLNSVDMIDAKNGWSVGNSGTIIKYTDIFFTSGNFVSSVLDTGTTTSRFFQSIFWSEILPAATDIMVATRSGDTATPDITWSSFSADSSLATSTPILSPGGRYLQYRVTLSTGDTSTTSQLQDITVTYK